MRLRIDVAYDGTEFHGWARQPELRTVQGLLEPSIATALRLPEIPVTCAGRTDTGVHARGQVVHCDVSEQQLIESAGRSNEAPLQALRRRVNGILPRDVRVRRVTEAPDSFDARFSALWRRYIYRIDDGAVLDPLQRNHVVAWPRPLDADAMHLAAQQLLGENDYAAFCKKRPGATTVRTLLNFSVERVDGLIMATVRADAFCHSMVRALMGCVIAVGDGRQSPEWAREVLTSRRRNPAVTVARAHGLTLEEVAYPADELLGSQADGARRMRSLGEDE